MPSHVALHELPDEEALFYWRSLSDDIILHIFQFLPASDLIRAAQVCLSWHRVAGDDFLWRELVYRKWKISRQILMRPGACSWLNEYRRLVYCTPAVLCEELTSHTDQVLHVAFSHNGKMFSTTSKDGCINTFFTGQSWNPSYMITVNNLKCIVNFVMDVNIRDEGHNVILFSTLIKVWNNTNPVTLRNTADMNKLHQWRYTQFSQFNVGDSLLLVSGVYPGDTQTMGGIAIFSLQPQFTILGAVKNKPYDIFGAWFDETQFIFGDLQWRGHLSSCSYLFVSSAENCSNGSSSHLLYKFHNLKASSVRTVTVARPKITSTSYSSGACVTAAGRRRTPNCCQHRYEALLDSDFSDSNDDRSDGENEPTRCEFESKKSDSNLERLVIFTMGSETYTPHQIGIKRFSTSDVAKTKQNDVGDPDDEPDYKIEMNSHIIGMSLSPDHRYLYVNSRAWPKNCDIEDPLYPPPIAQEIDVDVIDLATMSKLDYKFRSHKAFTSNDECFFIFLDVSNKYVASGAEDHLGYLWDRHYRILLHTYPHDDVVNCVAFCPTDSEIVVSVSDDNKIKVWRSRHRLRSAGAAAAAAQFRSDDSMTFS